MGRLAGHKLSGYLNFMQQETFPTKLDASLFALLHKYDVPGPRYTSYPTVPIWSDQVGPSDYEKNLLAVAGEEPLSLYFHLPFCEKLCHFCGCMKVITPDHSRSRAYVNSLLKEMDTVFAKLGNSKKNLSQIHFGGGSPNFLQPEELSLIMQKVRQSCVILPGAEIAIEMHPRTTTHAFADNLKIEGFNRISLGVQDFDETVQRLINRFQTYEMTRDMCGYLRSLGFAQFNFDLIYGLPGQTMATFENTLKQTLTLKPDRLAVYSYAHVPWVSPVQRAFKDEDIPTPETKLKLFQMAYTFFLENGYQAIGMDHFALESDELFKAKQEASVHRNFMGYSTRAEAHQIGFGVSAISYVKGQYFQNEKKLEAYQSLAGAGALTTHRGYLLSRDDQIRRELITRLMCHMSVDVRIFEKDFAINFADYFRDDLRLLTDFVADGLLTLTSDYLKVVGFGHLFLRNMAMCFDRHLEVIRQQAKNPVFSRTV